MYAIRSYYVIRHDKLVGGSGSMQDITDRKKAELQLQESEKKYRSFFEDSADVMVVLEDGIFTDFNRKAYEEFGSSFRNNFV